MKPRAFAFAIIACWYSGGTTLAFECQFGICDVMSQAKEQISEASTDAMKKAAEARDYANSTWETAQQQSADWVAKADQVWESAKALDLLRSLSVDSIIRELDDPVLFQWQGVTRLVVDDMKRRPQWWVGLGVTAIITGASTALGTGACTAATSAAGPMVMVPVGKMCGKAAAYGATVAMLKGYELAGMQLDPSAMEIGAQFGTSLGFTGIERLMSAAAPGKVSELTFAAASLAMSLGLASRPDQ